MDNLLLQLDNITTVYGRNEMLRNVSLDVPAGTVTCLLGSNGAGKSTLIKAILGLVKITKGKIIFDGKDITGFPTHKVIGAGIAIVPEGKRIFPKMTVRENLRMGAYLEKDNMKIEKRMAEIFVLYPRLKERINQIAGTLSGGEQSMLSIGRGLMSDPKLMIFDEPSLGLAPILVEQNFDTIKEINSRGTTVFLVEQNVHLTLEYASRGYVLQQGEVVASGSVDELKQSEVLKTAYLG